MTEAEIVQQHRVNKEENGHVDFFTRIEQLFLEAEALDLVEVESSFWWYHVIHRGTNGRLAALVLRPVEGQRRLPDPDLDLALLRHEGPGAGSVHVRLEVDRDDPRTLR